MTRTLGRSAGSLLALCLLALGPQTARAQDHPYLFFTADQVPELWSKLQTGVPLAAYQQMCSWIWTWGWPDTYLGKCFEEVTFLYRLTGNSYYASGLIPALGSATGVDPATFYDPDHMELFGAWPIPIAVAYDLAYDQLDDATRQQVVANLEQYGELLFGYTDDGTRPPLTGPEVTAYAGLGLLALAIIHDTSNGAVADWLQAAADQLGSAAMNDVYNPGGAFDGGFGASLWGGPEALRFAEAYRLHTLRQGSEVDLLACWNLRSAPIWYTYGWLPHERHAAWGDATSYLQGQAFSGEHLLSVRASANRVGRWGWHRIHGSWGVDGLYRPGPLSDYLAVALWFPDEQIGPPDPSALGYGLDRRFYDTASPADSHLGTSPGQGGAVIFRTSWDYDAVALAFKVSDEWQPQSHNDSSSFILSAYGVEMAMDPPSPQYPSRDDHSVVLVADSNDGATERTSYRGAFHEVFSGPGVGYASADARYPSGSHDPGDPADLSDDVWLPVLRADRAVALVRGPRPYVIVADDVSADGLYMQSYQWLMPLGPNAWYFSPGSGEPGSPIAVEYYGSEQLLATVVAPAVGYAAEVEPHPEAQSFNRLVVTTYGAEARYLLVLQPRLYNGQPEQPEITRLELSGGAGAELSWYNRFDRVLFRYDEAVSSTDGDWFDGRLAITHHDGDDGSIVGWLAAEGTGLFSGGRGLLDMGGLKGTAALYCAQPGDCSQLDVQTAEPPAPRQIAAYAPAVSQVILNGVSVAFVQMGDYVLLPAGCAAVEHCNGLDDDCDGEIDEDAADALSWHPDDDGDGYGDAERSTTACQPPEGYVEDGTDCDDGDDDVNPGAVETCNDTEDDDCNGLIDKQDPACIEEEQVLPGDTMCTCRAGRHQGGALAPLWWLAAGALWLTRRRSRRARPGE